MKRLLSVDSKYKLMAVCILMVVLPVILIGIVTYNSAKASTFDQIEDSLMQEALVIKEGIQGTYDTAQTKVSSDLNVARNTLDQAGKPYLSPDKTIEVLAVNQITKESMTIKIAAMQIAGKDVYKNYEVVDSVRNLVGGTATIFQVVPQGMLRISTNVMQLDGQRAVGTYIPTDSPVYQSIMNGQTYYGRAYVVNAWYMTAYEPIRDSEGKVIGALYVGVKEDEYQQTIKDSLSGIVLGKTGYIYILNSQGDYVLSLEGKRDGENIWEAKDADGVFFIQEIVGKSNKLKGQETDVHYYPWQNTGEKDSRMKLAGLSYFPEWDWVIGASAYQEDFTDGLDEIRKRTIYISIIAIILGVIAAYIFANFISNQRKVEESFLHGLADPAFKTDADLIITDINDAAVKALGYSREEVVGKLRCADICKTHVCNTEKCTIRNCMRSKGSMTAETIAIAKDGTKIPIRASCGVLLDSRNQAVGGFEVISDLTALHSMVSNVEEIASGNLTVKIDDELCAKTDTTGTLAKSVDRMVKNLADLITRATRQANSSATSAEELSASSQEVNASVEQVTSTVQELAKGAQTVTKSSNDAQQKVKNTIDASKKGSASAKIVQEKMNEISQSTKISAEKIKKLNDKSREIGNIVDTINNISEQTNLLALNATIEAARAGDAGRGFAVVADEVRKLAEESQKATSQISDLIEGIQSEIEDSVKTMENNTKQVIDGSVAVNESVNAFESIPTLVNEVNMALNEMAAIAEENAAGSEELSSSTEQVSSSMQQVSSSAQMLAKGADELKQLISKFRVDDTSLSDIKSHSDKATRAPKAGPNGKV